MDYPSDGKQRPASGSNGRAAAQTPGSVGVQDALRARERRRAKSSNRQSQNSAMPETHEPSVAEAGYFVHHRSSTADIMQRNSALEDNLIKEGHSARRYPNLVSQEQLDKAAQAKKYQRFLRDYEPEWTSRNWNVAFGQHRNGTYIANLQSSRRSSSSTISSPALPTANSTYWSSSVKALAVCKSTAHMQSEQADLLRDHQSEVSGSSMSVRRSTTASPDGSVQYLVTKIRTKRSQKPPPEGTLFTYPAGQTVEITTVPQADADDSAKHHQTPNGTNKQYVAGRFLELEKIQYSVGHATPEFGDVAEPELGAIKSNTKYSMPSAALRKVLQRKTVSNSTCSDFDNSFARMYGTTTFDNGRWTDRGWMLQDRSYGSERAYSATASGAMTPRSAMTNDGIYTVNSSHAPMLAPSLLSQEMQSESVRRALNTKAFYPSYVNLQVLQQGQEESSRNDAPQAEEQYRYHQQKQRSANGLNHDATSNASPDRGSSNFDYGHNSSSADRVKFPFGDDGNVARVAVKYDVIIGETIPV